MVELYSLRDGPDIHILPADKGRNTVISNKTEYDLEAMRPLEDITTYQELERSEYKKQLKTLGKRCNKLAEPYMNKKTCREKKKRKYAGPKYKAQRYTSYQNPTRDSMQEPEQRKTGGGDPLSKNSHTGQVHNGPNRPAPCTYTQFPERHGDFLKNLLKVGKENTRIATADVIGLYPNIPWDEGVKASTRFYEQNLYWLKTYAVVENLKPPPEKGIFEKILKLILHNSDINFKNTRFFKQIQGTAMGMCISVFFANAYMYSLTKDYVHHPPKGISTFLRYIDDLIVITDRIFEEELNRFFAEISNSHLKHTIEKSEKSQPFLNLLIQIDPGTWKIETKTPGRKRHPNPSSTPNQTIPSTPSKAFLAHNS